MNQPDETAYVVANQLSLGEIEGAVGFVLVSRWDAGQGFRACVGSAAHGRSRARIPRDPPVVAVYCYQRVA